MKSNYRKLGDYIQKVDDRNIDLEVELLLGVSIRKVLIPSIANTIGTNMKTYKTLKQNQFAYGPVTSRNGDKISIALNEDNKKAIVSQAYTVFDIIDKNELDPEYLMMWFRRSEFDRYARFKSHGSAREIFDWEEICKVELPIPNIEKQREIVKEYNTVVNRIKLNETLNEKLEETAQSLYKHWFVDFEFPNKDGKPYKSSGGKLVYNTELDKEIPEGFSSFYLGDKLDLIKFPISKKDINEEMKYVPIDSLPKKSLFIKKHRNSNEANSSLILFKEKDILIGAMRVYFHRVCLSHFDGVTRSTTFVLRSKNVSDLFFLLFLCNQESTISYANSTSKGTTMPYAVWEDEFEKLRILFPTDRVLFLFNKIIDPILRTILSHSKEEEILKKTSHLLLSKMSKAETLQTEKAI